MTISTLEDISIIFTRITKSKSKRLKHTYYHRTSLSLWFYFRFERSKSRKNLVLSFYFLSIWQAITTDYNSCLCFGRAGLFLGFVDSNQVD